MDFDSYDCHNNAMPLQILKRNFFNAKNSHEFIQNFDLIFGAIMLMVCQLLIYQSYGIV